MNAPMPGTDALEKNFEMSLLLDFYGEILSDKQREAMNLYYNEDLSLSEIADKCQQRRKFTVYSQSVGKTCVFAAVVPDVLML